MSLSSLQVQVQVLDAVAHLPAHTPGLADAVSQLNADLLDVTQVRTKLD